MKLLLDSGSLKFFWKLLIIFIIIAFSYNISKKRILNGQINFKDFQYSYLHNFNLLFSIGTDL